VSVISVKNVTNGHRKNSRRLAVINQRRAVSELYAVGNEFRSQRSLCASHRNRASEVDDKSICHAEREYDRKKEIRCSTCVSVCIVCQSVSQSICLKKPWITA